MYVPKNGSTCMYAYIYARVCVRVMSDLNVYDPFFTGSVMSHVYGPLNAYMCLHIPYMYCVIRGGWLAQKPARRVKAPWYWRCREEMLWIAIQMEDQ